MHDGLTFRASEFEWYGMVWYGLAFFRGVTLSWWSLSIIFGLVIYVLPRVVFGDLAFSDLASLLLLSIGFTIGRQSSRRGSDFQIEISDVHTPFSRNLQWTDHADRGSDVGDHLGEKIVRSIIDSSCFAAADCTSRKYSVSSETSWIVFNLYAFINFGPWTLRASMRECDAEERYGCI
jgi:hypothetical protein